MNAKEHHALAHIYHHNSQQMYIMYIFVRNFLHMTQASLVTYWFKLHTNINQL